MREVTLGSLFDGIGGFPYAASFYGIRSLWASEIVPACVSVTQRHFPDMLPLGDITRLHGGKLPPVDIITFGSPCQGLSTSGRRLGLADERSGLFMEAIRIINEMREGTHGEYPRFALFENVPGALSSSGRRDYQAVLRSFTKAEIPMPRSGQWANAGMARGRGVDLAWCMYDSQYFGTAQRRRRLFLVCDFRGNRSGEILFVPKSLQGYFEAGGTPRQGLTAFAENGAAAASGDLTGQFGNADNSDISPSLRSQTRDNLPIVAAGFDLQQITSKSNRSSMKPVQPTLCKVGRPHVVAGTVCMATTQANSEIVENIASTLTCNHDWPIVTSAGFRYKAGSMAGSIGYQEETAPTLLAGQQSAVLNCGYADLTVRRLMPVEAERLMGFKDFWTEFGCKGEKISDTARFQMLGNSIAVPCAAYIMQGIRQVMEDADV